MGRILTAEFRTIIAALCVALSFVFAGASAASVVDKVQHSARIAHEHAGQLALSVVEADHHIDHHVEGDQPDDNDAPGDHPSGVSHHHSDAPTGILNDIAPSEATERSAQKTLSIDAAEAAKGVRPGGLKRPPKDIANLD